MLGQVILVAIEVALADRYAVLVQGPLELVAGVCVLPLRACVVTRPRSEPTLRRMRGTARGTERQ